MEDKWLKWARELQAMAQNGLAYAKNPFDIERYERLRELSVEILDEYTEAGTEKIRDLFCNEVGYQTPKVDVRGAVIEDGRILLVKERLEGKWSLPGGWADVGLSVRDNVEKEMREESGLIVRATRLVSVQDWLKSRKNAPFSLYKMTMLCENQGGAFEANIETEDAGYFSMDELPPLTHKISEELLAMCFKAADQPDWIPPVD